MFETAMEYLIMYLMYFFSIGICFTYTNIYDTKFNSKISDCIAMDPYYQRQEVTEIYLIEKKETNT